uniref:Uncharacterized protein n=1 Tax=Opuntia streptacantha TaxID=393608 RepID=A0A7C9AVU9_OPUST
MADSLFNPLEKLSKSITKLSDLIPPSSFFPTFMSLSETLMLSIESIFPVFGGCLMRFVWLTGKWREVGRNSVLRAWKSPIVKLCSPLPPSLGFRGKSKGES